MYCRQCVLVFSRKLALDRVWAAAFLPASNLLATAEVSANVDLLATAGVSEPAKLSDTAVVSDTEGFPESLGASENEDL